MAKRRDTGSGESNALRIIGIGGSLSSSSTSLRALAQCLDGAAAAGAATKLFDVRLLALPMFDPSADPPAAAVELCAAVAGADGLLWSSPLYHGTISGSFKNALDWLQLLADYDPPYLTDKVVGLISTAGGAQGLQAVNTMEFVVRALRGWAVPMVIAIPQAFRAFDHDGQVLDERVAEAPQSRRRSCASRPAVPRSRPTGRRRRLPRRNRDETVTTDLNVGIMDDPQRSRYVADVDGEPAGFAEYVLESGHIIFTHTVVEDKFDGQGVGSRLAAWVLDDARARHLSVEPRCPFIAAYIDRHPGYSDLVEHAEGS